MRLAREVMRWTTSETPRGGVFAKDVSGEIVAHLSGWGLSPRWNPFTDANADVQVLERCRELWSYDPGDEQTLTDVRWDEFNAALHHLWTTNAGPKWDRHRYYDPCRYTTGDYARAALAVLDSTPTTSTNAER